MKHITLSEDLKEEALKAFKEKLETERSTEGCINFSFDFQKNILSENNKIILNIDSEAYLKMWELVNNESGEIGWHGLVTRHNDKLFEIKDILLYPQEVSSVTVTTDEVAYGDWLHKELSDEEINALRFHGHSHVNMSTYPSGVDKAWYNDILQGLFNDDFYIFMILNKKREYFIEIYDLKTNTIYEKNDIIINVLLSDNNYLKNWANRNKEKYLKCPINSITTRLATTKIADLQYIKNFILGVSELELNDPEFSKEIQKSLAPYSTITNYYGLGWYQWQTASLKRRVEAAQAYFIGSKSEKKNKNKSKNKATEKEFYDYWKGALYEDD